MRFKEVEQSISQIHKTLSNGLPIMKEDGIKEDITNEVLTDEYVTNESANNESIKEHLHNDSSVMNNIINEVEKDIHSDVIQEINKVDKIEKDTLPLAPSFGGLFISVETDSGTKDITDERIVEINEENNDEIIDNAPSNNEPVDNANEPDKEISLNKTFIDEPTYEECTIKELKTILEEMGLSTSGNKYKLIQRITSNKK